VTVCAIIGDYSSRLVLIDDQTNCAYGLCSLPPALFFFSFGASYTLCIYRWICAYYFRQVDIIKTYRILLVLFQVVASSVVVVGCSLLCWQRNTTNSTKIVELAGWFSEIPIFAGFLLGATGFIIYGSRIIASLRRGYAMRYKVEGSPRERDGDLYVVSWQTAILSLSNVLGLLLSIVLFILFYYSKIEHLKLRQ